MWFRSEGIVKYGPGQRVVLEVDKEIVNYYTKLLPKYITFNRQKWEAHVSIVREYEQPTNWNLFQNEVLDFEYCNIVDCDETYMWLNVKAAKIEKIRVSLGLAPIPPWRNYFHITIGNFKHV